MNERYSRQLRFTPIGPEGQQRLGAATAVVVGCGALGTVILDQLARAGVGHIRCIDRDFVEPSNLQRQSLYDEADAAACRPKAEAAAARLRAVNGDVTIEPLVAEVGARTVEGLVAGATVVLDGTDNFRTRHLINEACVCAGIPWVYGACVGSYGLSLTITPGDGPCLACLQDQLPGPGETPTCDTAGIIAPAVHQVAAWQVAEALKLIVGAPVCRDLRSADLWAGTHRRVAAHAWRDAACPVCGPSPRFPLLSTPDDPAVVLCGRDAVQVSRPTTLDPVALAERLGTAVVGANAWLVRWRDGAATLTAFADGRVVVQGVADPAAARTLVDRWLG
jgi:adenylyltransferase/sulfurtransferase